MDDWTPAALEAYRTCPRLHAFRYVERVPLGPSLAAPWVEAVRAAVLAYDISGRPADLWDALRRNWPACGAAEWARAVGACGRRLATAPAPAAAAGLAFKIDLGGGVVAGRADRIDRLAGAPASERLVAYRIDGAGPSMREMVFAAAALGAAGRPVAAIRIEDLDDGAVDERAVAPDDRAAALAEARSIAAEAAADRHRRPRAGPHCAACAYALACPAVGGLDARRSIRDLLVVHRATRAAAAASPEEVVRIVAEAAGAIAGAEVEIIRRDALAAAGPGLARVLAGADPARAAIVRSGEALEVAPGGALLLPLGAAGLLVVPRAPAEAEAALALLARTAAWAAAAADERRRAATDALTGLPNRGAFDAALAAALAAGAPVSLAIIDLDRFKAINDSLGHRAGDAALRRVAGILRAAPGPAHRIGGEEFGLLLPGDAEAAVAAAEEVRAAIAAAPVEHDGGSFCVTASIGLARLGADGSTYSDVLAAADAALYRAKAGGRNRVRAAWETPVVG